MRAFLVIVTAAPQALPGLGCVTVDEQSPLGRPARSTPHRDTAAPAAPTQGDARAEVAGGASAQTSQAVEPPLPEQAVEPPPPEQVEPPPELEDVSAFHEPLSPYGVWVSSSHYGEVWVPAAEVVGGGWRPYSYGHWVLTEYGWTWVSDFEWGWATFHYGRWGWDPMYGWVWAPGVVWGPAWVYWRTGSSYLGWAPVPPGAVVGRYVEVAPGSWVFVESRRFMEPRIHSHIIYGSRVSVCLSHTAYYDHVYVVHSRRYYYGPRVDYVRHHTHRAVRHRPARSLDTEARSVYRQPDRRAGSTSGHHRGDSRRGYSPTQRKVAPRQGTPRDRPPAASPPPEEQRKRKKKQDKQSKRRPPRR